MPISIKNRNQLEKQILSTLLGFQRFILNFIYRENKSAKTLIYTN